VSRVCEPCVCDRDVTVSAERFAMSVNASRMCPVAKRGELPAVTPKLTMMRQIRGRFFIGHLYSTAPSLARLED